MPSTGSIATVEEAVHALYWEYSHSRGGSACPLLAVWAGCPWVASIGVYVKGGGGGGWSLERL